jgi:hypothetical protein
MFRGLDDEMARTRNGDARLITSSPEATAAEPSKRFQATSSKPQRVVTVDDLMSMGWRKFLLLLIAPIAAAAIAYGIAGLLTPRYTSVAYLKLDEAGARAADALMRSSPVADKVMARLGLPEGTVDGLPRLNDNRRIIVAAGDLQATAKLFRLEYSDKDPHVAQRINSLFIDAWLSSAGPSLERHNGLNAEIQRKNGLIEDISKQINWAVKDLSPRASQENQSEILVIIKNLLEKREQQVNQVSSLITEDNGVAPDSVFGSPDLPVKPSWPEKRIIAILAGAITALCLFVSLAMGLSKPKLLSQQYRN